MTQRSIRIRRPDDFHVHLRQGDVLRSVIGGTARVFARALVMPNLTPPVLTGKQALTYRSQIIEAALAANVRSFEPLMTIKLVGSTTPDVIGLAAAEGVTAGKLYPEGVTTNSEDGVRDIKGLYPVFEKMQDVGMVLCLHGEVPGVFCMDREMAFLGVLEDIAHAFPRLRIVLEHVTTWGAVASVKSLPATVVATVTPHHLVLTLDDVVGDKLQPHHFCKPIAKRESDRTALVEAVTSGNPKFFLGTDSAPHVRETKECASGCAGIFCAPVAMDVLAEVFEKEGKLERLEAFTSEFGARFYGLPLNQDYVRLVEESHEVPHYVSPGPGAQEFAAFCGGQTLRWSCQVE